MLDRAAPQRAAAVARPGAHADGLSTPALLLHVVSTQTTQHPILSYRCTVRSGFIGKHYQICSF